MSGSDKGLSSECAPGVACIRLSGSAEDVEVLTSVLERVAAGLPVTTVGVEILTRSAPYLNRRDPGQRVYLTVRVQTRKEGRVS